MIGQRRRAKQKGGKREGEGERARGAGFHVSNNGPLSNGGTFTQKKRRAR